MNSNKNLEILAPAGNFEKLETVVRFGADAVYLSGKKFGMRSFAGNFEDFELERAVKLCREKNVQLYVTINIIAHNDDLDGLEEYLLFLQQIKVDAVIVSDFGILERVKKTIPDMPIHISTQFSATNFETIKFLEGLGVTRVVLPRELSLKEIIEIKKNTTVELEVFVHGAMCMAYSGRCMISYHTKDRDANRGECNQSCRFEYNVTSKQIPEGIDIEEDETGTHFFNSKDLCLIEHIPDLVKAGVTSFKIEGRMKPVSYLSTVVKSYKEVLESYLANEENFIFDPIWMEEIEKVSNRGYTKFKFEAEDNSSIITRETQNREKSKVEITHDIVGIVKEIVDKKFMVVEVKAAFVPGQEIDLVIPRKRVLQVKFDVIKDVLGREIQRTNPNQIVVLRHFKSVEPGSVLRGKRE